MCRGKKVASPFGEPSDELCFGTLAGTRVVFLPRHGRGHRLSPSDIDFRAQHRRAEALGGSPTSSRLSAVGSLRKDLPPGTFVLVDQFIDRTFARKKSFFGTGCVAHVSLAHPVCPRLGDALIGGGRSRGDRVQPRRAPISRWKDRSSPPSPRASSTAPGAPRSSA